MFWVPKYLAADRGLDTAQIGRLYWIPFLALGLANVASGWLADRLLRAGWTARAARRTVLTGAALVTTTSGLVLEAPSVGWAIALMAAVMAAHGFWISSYVTLIGDLYPSRVVATVVGLTGTVGGAAAVLSNLVTGPIIERQGFLPLFLGAAVLYPLALIFLLSIPAAEEPAHAA
jgi:ACS family hexuronate transporter-like MFS transporter